MLGCVACLEPNPAWDLPADGDTLASSGSGESSSEATGAETGSGEAGSSDTTGSTDTASDTTTDTTSDTGGSSDCGTIDPAKLLCCYDFEQIESGIIQNLAADVLHGTSTGVDAAAGVPGLAAVFEPGSLGTVPHSEELNLDALTVEAWIYVTTIPTGSDQVAIVVQQEGVFELGVSGNAKIRCGLNTVGGLLGGNVNLEEWTHVACTYDGVLRMYQDGQPRGMVGDDTDPLPTSNSDLLFGNTAMLDQPYEGRLDTMRIWGRALSEAELCELAGDLC